jgi:zinc protease
VVHPGSVRAAAAALADVFPRHVCFVARPEEAGREFVIAVHRLLRTLDDDPYTDVIWAILTGYEAADALRIAAHAEPLRVGKVAAGCGVDLAAFREGVWYSEGQQGVMWRRQPGAEPEQLECAKDTTKLLVDALVDGAPDMFLTSGHATQHDWQIGYSYKNGQFRCRDGQLVGIDTANTVFPIVSPNPKIYSGAGNCLIGLIDGRDTMALAWLRTGGAGQFLGYVVSTWYGYGGHGTNQVFVDHQGRVTFAEAFYLNNVALVHELVARFPAHAGVDFDRWNIESDHELPGKLAQQHGLADRDAVGLLWDRDTVALYGDPAWDARIEPARAPAWEQELVATDDGFRFTVTVPEGARFARPPMALLPWRLGDVEVTAGQQLGAVVTDNFVLLPAPQDAAPGQQLVVEFRGRRL